MTDSSAAPTIRKRKICFVQPKSSAYFFPEAKIVGGGSERQVYLLSRALAKHQNLEVHVCLADPGESFRSEVDGITLWKGLNLHSSRLGQLLRLRRTLKAIDADIYLFRSPDLGVAVCTFLVKILGKPFAYQMSSKVEMMPGGLKQVCGQLGSLGMKWVYQNATGLLAQTKEQANMLRQHYGLEATGIQPNLFTPSITKRERPAERKNVLWVGRCDPIKRGTLFIELAKSFPETPFIMVCPPVLGWESLYQSWFKMAKDVPNLQWIGEACNGEALNDLYFRSRVLLMTSESEGYSNVMMEAWYGELPLVTTAIDPDETISKNSLGYVAQWEGTDLKDKLSELLKHPEEERSMGRKARAFLEENHMEETCVESFLHHVHKLLSS